MSYDEEQQKRSRVVIETPNARREVVEQKTVRQPAPGYYPPERRGYSTGVLATVALLAIAATAIIFLFITNSRDDSSTNVNINARDAAATQPTPFAQAPVIVQTPLPQPTPIIVQAPTTVAPPPIIVQAPPPGTTTAAPPTTTAPPASTAPPAAAAGHDDATLQTKIDKAFADDPAVSAATIDATVVNGRVRLSGTVNSDAVKQRAERLAYAVKGVLGVDNKITVTAGTP
ncbi:MAG: BON domain-containing protein [Acidobacteria bacterium]|nr:BON domain-containing protein [Acidobacteriota bacterium]